MLEIHLQKKFLPSLPAGYGTEPYVPRAFRGGTDGAGIESTSRLAESVAVDTAEELIVEGEWRIRDVVAMHAAEEVAIDDVAIGNGAPARVFASPGTAAFK